MNTRTAAIVSPATIPNQSSFNTFKPIQSWDKSFSIPVQSLQHGSNEDIMIVESLEKDSLSPPYGLKSSVDEDFNLCTEDLYKDMLERQVEFVSPKTYAPKAAYLPYRRYIVDWMSDICEQNNLLNTTVHVSILYFDRIFRSNNIPRNEWQLLATACISVAAKYEEAEEYCPPIPDLLRLTKLNQAGHTSLSFRDGEVQVLRHLGWRLRAIPPLHIIGYYLAKGATFQNDLWQNRALIEKIPKYVKKYAEFFCNLTLQEYAFQQYLPSHLAAAIILASRVALQLQPRWRPELVILTGYEELEIKDVFDHVWNYYEEQFPGHSVRSISPRSINF